MAKTKKSKKYHVHKWEVDVGSEFSGCLCENDCNCDKYVHFVVAKCKCGAVLDSSEIADKLNKLNWYEDNFEG